MKRGRLLKPVLWLTAACIILPAIVLLIWCFAARWPWPGILPESLSLRTVKELIFGSAKLPKLLLSSISLSFAVAAISTTIGIATARATELYEFRGKGLIRFFSLLPLLVPGTVLAIGAQIMLLKVGLGDSIAGIILIHTVASVPYCITIMTDVTAALGDKFEEQAATLGAGPVPGIFRGDAAKPYARHNELVFHGIHNFLQPVFHHSYNRRRQDKYHIAGAGAVYPGGRQKPGVCVRNGIHPICPGSIRNVGAADI